MVRKNAPVEPLQTGGWFQGGVIIDLHEQGSIIYVLTAAGEVYTLHRKGGTWNICRKETFKGKQLVARAVKLTRYHLGIDAVRKRSELVSAAYPASAMETLRETGVLFGGVISRVLPRDKSLYIFSLDGHVYNAHHYRGAWCLVKIGYGKE
jgi:hypothetical protein